MKKVFLSLILILLVSGCAGLPFDIPFFGTQGPEVKELGPDIVTIEKIEVIPKTSVLPNDQFSVYFEVKNQDEHERIDQFNISYYLYDTGLCDYKPKTGENAESPQYIKDGLAPLETRFFDWAFQAPDEGTIAYLSTTCPIRWKINYTYTAKSQIDVDTIDNDRYWELQRAGNFTTSVPHLSVGRGPVKIYFDFGTTLPVRENATLPIYIRVEDKGNGALGMIDNESDQHLSIYIPKDGFNATGADCTHYFRGPIDTNPSDADKGYWEFNNNQPGGEIPLINKKSFEIRCRDIKVRDVDYQQTFYIMANMTYTYDIFGEVKIEVKP